MSSGKSRLTNRSLGVLTPFGQRQLGELAKKRSEPADPSHRVLYYGGWMMMILNLIALLSLLATLTLGLFTVLEGDIDAFRWGIALVYYLAIAVLTSHLSDQAFEVSGVEP